MAEFTEYLHKLRPCESFAEVVDMNMEMLKQLPELNPSMLENFSAANFTTNSFLAHPQQPEFPGSYCHNYQSSSSNPSILNQNVVAESKKRKEPEQSRSNSLNISPSASSLINTNIKNTPGRGKKWKNKEKEVDATEEVIHVRAKRGQATDSHSIAERVRREKINNKLRCLQDLVPGCHKSMGMAVMLEEIINYVHSLQNQVEFLSMELAAASCSYDLSLETESSKKAQGTNSVDVEGAQKWLRERCGEPSCYHSTWSN